MGTETKKIRPEDDPNDIKYVQKEPWEIAPSDEVFKEIIEAAKVVWTTQFSDEHGYVTEKLNRVNNIRNHESEVMVALRMFHTLLRREIVSRLSPEAQNYVKLQGEQ